MHMCYKLNEIHDITFVTAFIIIFAYSVHNDMKSLSKVHVPFR